MAKHTEKMKRWVESFAADVAAVRALVANEKAPREARLLGAAALNYLVTRLDLIPDWEETCGIVDDAMVLRLAMAEASENDLDALSGEAMKAVHRLANEAEGVREMLGDTLYPKLKRYVHDLTGVVVRGRHPRVIVEQHEERERLFQEVDDDLARLPPASMADPDRIERIVLNTLTTKLK